MEAAGGRRQQGSLLIISLWLVTILSVLAVAIGRYLSTEVRLARYALAQARAAALARGGVYSALHLLEADLAAPETGGTAYDWLGDDWAQFSTGGADDDTWMLEWPLDAANPLRGTQRLDITIIDEERKLNLQSVPSDTGQPPFAALETLLGSREAAVALVDWGDADPTPLDPARPGTEADEVTGWRAKNGPAARLEELFAIPGLRDVGQATLRDTISVFYGATAKPNINTVSPAVLSALGLPALASVIADCRQRGVIFDNPTEMIADADDCLGSAGALPAPEQGRLADFGIASQTFTVVAESLITESDANGATRPPVRARAEAVVRRTECDPLPTPCIIAWSR